MHGWPNPSAGGRNMNRDQFLSARGKDYGLVDQIVLYSQNKTGKPLALLFLKCLTKATEGKKKTGSVEQYLKI
jgi:hypothetical protein